ncbi:hypothetical protein [Actinokineospora inagensis]|uniref:hypothetical protein n=1 Tax=Actinokineospora inagensis TaxID=103730 RepID=UPI000A03DADB|nr:hypothetical protein [Actinokineospora inagensis]
MTSRYDDADYQLRWPRTLFVAEAAKLLNQRERANWEEECELLLEDAFVGGVSGGPLAEYDQILSAAAVRDDPWSTETIRFGLTSRQQFLHTLMKSADRLREDSAHRKPYWSQRKKAAQEIHVRHQTIVGQFVSLVRDFDERGYFEKWFDKDCVDNPSTVDISGLIEHEIGVPDLWPLQPSRLTDQDTFCDVIEILHDFVARPVSRTMHSYGGCGWHHNSFSVEAGRTVYRWRVNQILGRSSMQVRLSDAGEDAGRLITVTDPEREALLHSILQREQEDTTDQLRHAIALFRARDADRHQKRSAVVALAHILEERRDLIKDRMLSKDEDVLFQIANRFNIRHQSAAQQGDYDVAFLDWIFWWYLATIELTDTLGSRHLAEPTDNAKTADGS